MMEMFSIGSLWVSICLLLTNQTNEFPNSLAKTLKVEFRSRTDGTNR